MVHLGAATPFTTHAHAEALGVSAPESITFRACLPTMEGRRAAGLGNQGSSHSLPLLEIMPLN